MANQESQIIQRKLKNHRYLNGKSRIAVNEMAILEFLCLSLPYTLKHLIFGASNLGDFKSLAYWCSLIFVVSQFSVITYIGF